MTAFRGRHRGLPRHRPVEVRVRFAPLPPEDVVIINGFRVTSIVRTLIDLAGDLSRDESIRITKQAIDKGLVTLDELRHAAQTRNDLPSIESFRLVLRDFELS